MQEEATAAAWVGLTLLTGLLASIAVMVVGLVLASHGGQRMVTTVLPLDRVVPELMHGSTSALLDGGILLLFATPMLGVVAALARFLRQGDREFSVITGFLLLVLLAGFGVALR